MVCDRGDWDRFSGRNPVDHVKRAGLAEWAFSLHRTVLCFGEESGYWRWRRGEKGATEGETFPSVPIRQEAEVPDLHEPGREHVEQEATYELDGIQGHPLLLIAVRRVPPAKGHLTVAHLQQAPIGNGDTMRVASEVLDQVFRTAKWGLGVDHPVQAAQSEQEAVELGGILQVG